MTTSLRIAAFLLAVLPVAAAQARDARATSTTPRERAAVETARKFSARMSRLDALMGGLPQSPATRARSANAEH